MNTNKPKNNGIIITSPYPKSGKTVIATGIGASLLSAGMKTDYLKPVSYSLDCQDAQFYQLVTKFKPVSREFPVIKWLNMTKGIWNELIFTLDEAVYPVILESPVSITTPLQAQEGLMDITDISKIQDWPLIIVTSTSSLLFEQTSLALNYAKSKKAPILGFIFTCNNPNSDLTNIEKYSEVLSTLYQVPFLGMLPYSPSISVEEKRQGNIIKLTQTNLDLLPIQKTLNAAIFR